jgi:hypothetical protein
MPLAMEQHQQGQDFYEITLRTRLSYTSTTVNVSTYSTNINCNSIFNCVIFYIEVYSLLVELGPSFMNCEFFNRYNLRERHSLSPGQRQCTLFGKNSRMSETGQCPLRNTVSLIAGHQNKEVYETCYGFRNANYSRSRARDFFIKQLEICRTD